MTFYTVQPGDTLARITRTLFGSSRTWQQWAEWARIDAHHLSVGQRIPIPPWPIRPHWPVQEHETPYYRFGSRYPSDSPWHSTPHPGVDFHDALGAHVCAAGPGIVRKAGSNPPGYGHYVVIEHRLTTGKPRWVLMAHLGIPSLVPEWSTVEYGQLIGFEGMTGAAGGLSHVHYEVGKVALPVGYSNITVGNLRVLFTDPYQFFEDPLTLLLPIACWECPQYRIV